MKKAGLLAVASVAWMLTQGASVAYAGTSGMAGMSSTTGNSSTSNSMDNMSRGMKSASSMPGMNQAPGLMNTDVAVKSVGDSKVSGTATMSVTQSGLHVTLQLTGLTAGASYSPQIRYGEVGADAGNGWTLPTVKADSSGTASLTTDISGIVAIPEAGWYFRLDTQPSMQGMTGATVATGTIGEPSSSDTTVATATTASHLISLQIGPPGDMITPAQAAAGASGDIMPMSGGSMSGMNTTFDGEPVNHHLEAHVFNLKTGAVESDIMPMIAVTDPKTGKTSNVSAVPMYGSDVGMPDYHYGNNVYLASGSYDVTVAIGSEKAQFSGVNVTSVSDSSIIYVSPTGSDTSGQGTQESPYQSIDHALSLAPAHGTVIVEPGTYQETVRISKPVTLESDPSKPNAISSTIIDASGLDNALTITGSGASGTTVSGLTLEDAKQSGLLATGPVSNLTISNNVLTNNARGPIPKGQDYEALHLIGVTDSFLLNNQIINNDDGGLYLTDETAPNHNNIVAYNLVKDNKVDCGITIASHVANHGVYDNTIANNTSYGNGAAGVMLGTPVPGGIVSNNTVTENHVEYNHIGGIVLHTHSPGSKVNNNNIVRNWVVGNGADAGVTTVPTGIDIGASGSPIAGTVVENNLIGYESIGINVQDSAKSAIAGNWMNPNVKTPWHTQTMPHMTSRGNH